MEWMEALTYAQSSIGIAAIVGVVVFMAGEYIPGLLGWLEDSKAKRLVVLALCLVIPVGALLLELFTVSYAPITLDAVWAALFTGAGAFGIATAIHTTVLKK